MRGLNSYSTLSLCVSTLSAQNDQDRLYFNLCKNIQLRDKNTVHTDTGLLCDM